MINNTITVFEQNKKFGNDENIRWSAANLSRFCELAEIETGEATTNEQLHKHVAGADSYSGRRRSAYFNLAPAACDSLFNDFFHFLRGEITFTINAAGKQDIKNEFADDLHYARNLFDSKFYYDDNVVIENRNEHLLSQEEFEFENGHSLDKIECYNILKEFLKSRQEINDAAQNHRAAEPFSDSDYTSHYGEVVVKKIKIDEAGKMTFSYFSEQVNFGGGFVALKKRATVFSSPLHASATVRSYAADEGLKAGRFFGIERLIPKNSQKRNMRNITTDARQIVPGDWDGDDS